jgi:hypothetical protein
MKDHRRLLQWICAGVLAIACAPGALGQAKTGKHVKVPVVPARPEDVSSLERIVLADYESISGGVGVPRQWARDFALYDPHARFFLVEKDAKTGELKISAPTFQEFTDGMDASLVKDGSIERELAHKVYRYGNVATVFSSYEIKLSSTGEIVGRGVNIYQVYYARKRWWISSVSWDAEHAINEIPEELKQK